MLLWILPFNSVESFDQLVFFFSFFSKILFQANASVFKSNPIAMLFSVGRWAVSPLFGPWQGVCTEDGHETEPQQWPALLLLSPQEKCLSVLQVGCRIRLISATDSCACTCLRSTLCRTGVHTAHLCLCVCVAMYFCMFLLLSGCEHAFFFLFF